MKILHYINSLGPGGAEKLLTDILPIMKEQGHEVHLLISNEKNQVQKYHDLLQDRGIHINNLNSSNFNPLQVYHLIKLLRREKYDIVHAHIFPTQYWLALASAFSPSRTVLVKTEHNFFNNRRKYKLLKLLERAVYSRYVMVISITREVDQSLQGWLKKVKTVVIPNGLPLQRIHEEIAAGKDHRYEFFKEGQYKLLMVGRFSGAKDQETLIQAMQYLPAHYHLYFAGRGASFEQTKQFTARLGLRERVHFLGMRTDVYSLMNRVDLNILSTRFEGLSGVTLESLASGKPFIGADVPGVNDIVPDARLLFPAQQPELLAEKIKEISLNAELSRELVRISLAHVAKFDIHLMCERYLEVYENVLATTQEQIAV